MCGIWCCVSTFPCKCIELLPGNSTLAQETSCETNSPSSRDATNELKNCQLCDGQNKFISRRGPDSSSSRCLKTSTVPASYIHLISHVLWTQGEKVQPQPYFNTDESKLMLFNGDIYSFSGFNGLIENSADIESSHNDGISLFKLLDNCESDTEICKVLENLEGPFAFIFMDVSQNRMWFARDFFGRESLLFSYDEKVSDKACTWNISSVSVHKNVVEIPTSGLFCLEFESKELKLYPYSHTRDSVSALQNDFFSTLKKSTIINTATISDTQIHLQFATKLKFPEKSEDDALLSSLLNEAKLTTSAEEFLQRSIAHLSHYIDSLLDQLRKSIKRRVNTLPPFCKNCMLDLHHNSNLSSSRGKCDHSKVGVLFSGGLDSTVLAYLAAEAMPEGSSLDLINVGFSRDENFTNIPDRETALASYKMLKETFSPQGKLINLLLVNVGKAEVEEQRRERIKYLISPFKSVLDDSLGVCLWFAARGIGILYDNEEMGNGAFNRNYTSPIRVVLLGSGADELLGGYGRHRSAYEKSGWEGLRSEMQLDFDRISIRNMGRDNRIVSDHGICPRIPFLDEHVVDFLTAHCDLWVKCCPANVGPLGSRGSGEKLLLRAVGAKLFGDRYLSLALFPKRAMQFGSKIAKLENSKEKGGDSCQRLL